MKTFQITPVLHIASMEASIKYFIEVLGFQEVFKWGNPVFYAGVRYQSVTIHLNSSESSADRVGKGSVYIFSEDGVENYYEEVISKGAILIGNPPRKYDYGLIDVKFADPDGNWITFGQECD